MKIRYVLAILIFVAAFSVAIVSCSLLGTPVSIDQRVASFFSNLNSTDRSNVYNDFHPDLTTQYPALKNPVASGFNTLFPVPGTTYTYSIIDENNPSSGVIVQVLTGPTVDFHIPSALFLRLTMQTTNNNDWRIVTLADSATNGSYTIQIQ
jgi:hypothetical protein